MKARHARTRLRDHVRTAARSRARIRFEEHPVDDAVPDGAALVQVEPPRFSSDR
jgi:hypothetical protein